MDIRFLYRKLVMFRDSNYTTDREIRNIVSGLVDTLGRTLLTCLSKAQRNVTLSSREAEYVALSTFAQEVKLVSMLMGKMTKVENPSAIYEDNQGAIFLAKNRQVGICTNNIAIINHFLW